MLVSIWCYWVSMGRYWLVLGGSGSEWSGMVDGWLIKKIDDSTGSVEGGTG